MTSARTLAPFVPSTEFRPAPGLASPHAQTIYATIARSSRVSGVVEERWELPDGDFVDVSVLHASATAPHVLVLHGLESSASAGYIAATLREIKQRGWGAFAMNFRSCGTEMNRKPRSYHAGETGDATTVLRMIRTRVRGPVYGVGYSLGGGVMMKLLAETGHNALIDAASIVSVPFDLAECVRRMDGNGGWMTLYRERFLMRLRKKARDKAKRFPDFFDLAAIRNARTLLAFDELVTAPLHGFASASAYYASSSVGSRVAEIQKPTWVVNSIDDPLIPKETIPVDAMRANPFIQSMQTTHGGHVGFVTGTRLRPVYWGEHQAVAFLAHVDSTITRR